MWHNKFSGFEKIRSSLLCTGLLVFFSGTYVEPAHAEISVELTPHRAIYDLELDKATDRSGISSIAARLVYELKGSSCEGFTLNIRLVSNFAVKGGKKNITDIRISSFEGEKGANYQYSAQHYLNQIQTEAFKGLAVKTKDKVSAKQEEPSKEAIDLPPKTLFPNEHMIKVLYAALGGERLVQTVYFDGSDGLKPFRVSTIIGKHKVPGSVEFAKELPANARLKILSSWPIIMSYFKMDKESNSGEQTPAYETSFHMFENGVASNIKLSYRDFSIKGHLVNLEFFPPRKCD